MLGRFGEQRVDMWVIRLSLFYISFI